MDYGHDLRFGSFITPTNENAGHVVDLAVASEKAGLDLVTFQDHPYQASFLDTWTLLSYVAARTERVRLAPNVTSLPMRPPAVLARSVASLDQLTGGRVDLGLGAGFFWDAIEAMGGRRLTQGQAVDALDEAIQVIHALWGRGDKRVHGDYYSLTGARPGPARADLEIWIGAYKPRMLELTGRTADGWLPSIGRMSAQEIVDANARIDDAASAAGRSPADIRRLANVSGPVNPATTRQWIEQLSVLAREFGFSGFIFAADDAASLSIIGEEIAPAVRGVVESERGAA
jgi:alkanesulfonate monooxygenase SsuD/methylene tetrahydromethanopterin reductase-like flavin-dependent oxidoreductase (luciferase family)